MSRTPLKDRPLPDYSRKEELLNSLTHIIGAAVGAAVLVFAVLISLSRKNVWGVVSGSLYGAFMIILFSVSSVYHGLRPCYGKKVMRVIDHCCIYFLIAGTYTPILLSAMRPVHPALAWTLFGAQWLLAALATVFTAIDHDKYSKLSMAAYIGMGWLAVLALGPTVEVLTSRGFLLLLCGGLAYTLGAVLYGIGKKKPIFHTVFHVFVDAGAFLHAACILNYAL